MFLLRKHYGQRSLLGNSPWGLKELDMTERTHMGMHACAHTHTHITDIAFDQNYEMQERQA